MIDFMLLNSSASISGKNIIYTCVTMDNKKTIFLTIHGVIVTAIGVS